MFLDEDLRKVANQIEGSTIFAVFPLCRAYLPYERAEILEKAIRLLWKHDDKVITWADFSDTWKESFPESEQTDEQKTIQTTFDNRVKDESIAKNVIFGDNSDTKNSKKAMRIYYYFENKSPKDFIKHILRRYDINVRRFFEKSKEFIISDDIRKKLYNCREFNPSMLEEESYDLPLVIAKDKIWKQLFSKISRWDDLLDIVTVLTPRHNTPYDTDQLYSAIMALQATKDPKKPHFPQPVSNITSCKWCWRPALVKDARMAHKASCRLHSYESHDGSKAHTKPRDRAKEVDKELSKNPESESRLTAEMMRMFPTPSDENLFWIKLGLWDWWEHESPETVSPLPINDDTLCLLWDRLPHLQCFLKNRQCDLHNIKQIIDTLMPLPSGADKNAESDYRRWLEVWNNDFRYFLPMLSRAELWLAAFAKIYPQKAPDDVAGK